MKKFETNSRVIRITTKILQMTNCRICAKRSGIFDAYCGPKPIHKIRNWKEYRKTQYKLV